MNTDQLSSGTPYNFNIETRSFVFYGDECQISIDANMLAEIMLRYADERQLVSSLRRRGYRVQKRELGVLFDRWKDAS